MKSLPCESITKIWALLLGEISWFFFFFWRQVLLCSVACLFVFAFFFISVERVGFSAAEILNPAPRFKLKYLCLQFLLWADGCPREGKGNSYERSALQSICLRKCAASSDISAGSLGPAASTSLDGSFGVVCPWCLLNQPCSAHSQKCLAEMHYVPFCCFPENKALKVNRGFQERCRSCGADVPAVWQVRAVS